MRIGLIAETKTDIVLSETDPADMDSELLSAAEVDELLSGLQDAGHSVVLIGGAGQLLNRISHWRRRCDFVFNRSVGYRGVERRTIVPAILEAAGIPYLGSTPYVVTLVQNKHHTKLVVADAGVRTPAGILVTDNAPQGLERLTYPVIVKPVAESASLGIEQDRAVVSTPAAAAERAQEIRLRYHQPALVEPFVFGAEVEVPIVIDLIPKAQGVVAITLDGRVVERDRFLSSDTVYRDAYDFAAPPAYVSASRVAEAAVQAAAALGVRDYARIDFRVSEDGTPWFIEANVHPHLLRHSSFYYLAQQRGMAHHAMLDELVQVALRRDSKRTS